MARKFKQFDAAKIESGEEVLGFGLADKEFTCLPLLSANAMRELSKLGDEATDSLPAVIELIKDCLIDADVSLFESVLSEKSKYIVETKSLYEIVQFLLESYTARPLVLVSESSNGPSSTGEQ